MNTIIELNVSITTLSQFHIGTGFGMGKFIDKTTSRNKHGAVYIPGSTIKGKAKYFGRQIADSLGEKFCTENNPCRNEPCMICRIFGSALHQGKFFFSDANLSKKFTDIIIEEEGEENPAHAVRLYLNTRTGTKIDRRSGTVCEDSLFTIESGMRQIMLNSGIYGTGNDFTIKPGEKIPFELLLLIKSLNLITHLGGESSKGLGRVKIDIGPVYINGEEVEQ